MTGVFSQPDYPRDMVGYGREAPHPRWPGDARIAVQIAVNYEAGAESNVLHGDRASEGALTDTPFPPVPGERLTLVESAYEFGSRVGIWRLLDMFEERAINVSLFGVVQALERNPEVATAFARAGHEIVSHGYRWIDYRDVDEATERDLMRRAVEGIVRLTGERPVGWMTGRPSTRTRRLVVEEGGFLYDRDAFDQLYAEGARRPRLMPVGLHERTVGRPARAHGLARFLDHALAHEGVWFATGREIAEHWRREFPPR